MKLRNLKISKQLNFAQFIILAVVLTMGIISYFGVNSLWKNTEALHDHPFTVQGALASIQVNILNTRLMMEQIVLENGKAALQDEKAIVEGYESDTMKQINILYESYLGPKSDIDNAKKLIEIIAAKTIIYFFISPYLTLLYVLVLLLSLSSF